MDICTIFRGALDEFGFESGQLTVEPLADVLLADLPPEVGRIAFITANHNGKILEIWFSFPNFFEALFHCVK